MEPELHTEPPMTQGAPLYQTSDNEAVFYDRDPDTLIISFSARLKPAPPVFFGIDAMAKIGASAIHIRSMQNLWYADPDCYACIEAVYAYIQTRKFKRIVTYGFSMGAHGALRHAKGLGATQVVIGAPVATINPKVEKRWRHDYAHISEGWGRAQYDALLGCRHVPITVLADRASKDAVHINRLERDADAVILSVPYADHAVPKMLKAGGILGQVTRGLLSGSSDLVEIRQTIQAARKTNKMYLLALARHLHAHPTRQERVLAYAITRLEGAPDVVLAAAGMRAKRGNFDMAAADIVGVFARRGGAGINPALGQAIAEFCEAGGAPEAVAPVADAFAQDTPRTRESHLWYARYLRFTRQYQAALPVHDQFMQSGEFAAHAYFERGKVCELMGNFTAARTAYIAATALNPNLPRAAIALRNMTARHPVWALGMRVKSLLSGQRRR